MSFWSAIANFFKGFFRSVPALVTGILVGWACGPCNIVVAGILGGVTAAAVNTAINGGNWGQAIGMGAVLGGIAGGIGGDVFKGFGGIPDNGFNWGNFVAGVKTGAAFGAVIGGLNTAIHGGNFFQNVAMGALSGAVSSAAAFGIMKGATETYAAAKEWWNSLPGKEDNEQGYTSSSGKTITTTRGGTPAQQTSLDAELNRVFSTKRGQEMLKAIEASGKPIEIRLNNSGDLSSRTPGNYINLDINANPTIQTTAGPIPASTARIIAHELGHAVFGIGDVGTGRMANVTANENPVATELGEKARSRY
jgi:hypothetical protein